jgi:hypothetical protein
MWEGFEKHHFDCDCGSDEHTFKFTFDTEEGELYLSAYLNQYHNVFKRIWVAVKYVFGYTSKYGHWDTVMLSKNDTERLREVCERSLAARAAHAAQIHEEIEANKLAEMQAALQDFPLCSCMTKTPDVSYHAEDCRYRQAWESGMINRILDNNAQK